MENVASVRVYFRNNLMDCDTNWSQKRNVLNKKVEVTSWSKSNIIGFVQITSWQILTSQFSDNALLKIYVVLWSERISIKATQVAWRHTYDDPRHNELHFCCYSFKC